MKTIKAIDLWEALKSLDDLELKMFDVVIYDPETGDGKSVEVADATTGARQWQFRLIHREDTS
jgi:hypothetical protein